jgi:hypothetical protein
MYSFPCFKVDSLDRETMSVLLSWRCCSVLQYLNRILHAVCTTLNADLQIEGVLVNLICFPDCVQLCHAEKCWRTDVTI